MKKQCLLILMILLCGVQIQAAKKSKIIKITALPKEAAITINNQFINYGFAEFIRPKKNEIAAIRIECEGYKPLESMVLISEMLCLFHCKKTAFIVLQQLQD